MEKFHPQSLTIETIYNQTSKDFNEISRSSKSFGPSGNHLDKTYTTARARAQDDTQNSQELTERESWLLEEITDWVGVDINTGFYKKVISRLGEDVSREEFREAVYRDKTGEVIDRAKYLGKLLSKRLKDFPGKTRRREEGGLEVMMKKYFFLIGAGFKIPPGQRTKTYRHLKQRATINAEFKSPVLPP